MFLASIIINLKFCQNSSVCPIDLVAIWLNSCKATYVNVFISISLPFFLSVSKQKANFSHLFSLYAVN